MEFRITTDLAALPAAIEFNFDELKAQLDSGLEKYRGLVITEADIAGGKQDRATLNKLKTAIEDRRKEVKKQCLAPYEAFERRCKELTGMVDEAMSSIDVQIKSFEEQEKAEKREALIAIYQEYAGELAPLLPFEKVFVQKWLNKTVPLSSAGSELQDAIEKAARDIKIIRAMRCPCEDQMITAYLNRLDMSAALMEKSRYEARQEQLSKMKDAEAQQQLSVLTTPGHGALDQSEQKLMAEYIDQGLGRSVDPSLKGTKTIKVVFYDTTAAFRFEMKALTERHDIRYGGIQ